MNLGIQIFFFLKMVFVPYTVEGYNESASQDNSGPENFTWKLALVQVF